ncbi:sporulation histidine kinase inhibitor Sda [Paenibacillus sp. SYP-B4298]|uniref:sporulation histidine kinase inhibitor Sda n=1 Tax=Paenibacillus sp. SYP-B4298 TaxID=2996034 RepID=UPI0022DE105C|nr:sporulation histidine kinase inhibitor Sda [Paenibacillus sp. SYP-B4298]
MKISNPFLSMRNFIKPTDRSRRSSQRYNMEDSGYSVRFSVAKEPVYSDYSDKTLLLKPLNDEHLLEVYREAKAMCLSEDFIQLIESALEQRKIPLREVGNG